MLVKDYDFSISDALRPLTSSVAGFLNLSGKGEILPGNDADLLVMTPELRIEQVYARGKLMVKDGKACVKERLKRHKRLSAARMDVECPQGRLTE